MYLHVCTISYVQSIPSQFPMSTCVLVPASHRGQCMKLSFVSKPSFSSNLHTNCLLHSFSFIFSYLFFFIFSIASHPAPLPPSPPPLPTLYYSILFHTFVFSLFYSIVFPSTESPNVQGPDAAGCHYGVEVSLQFTRNPRGCQHSAPSYNTCCGHCHLQPPICSQPMAQHRRWVELSSHAQKCATPHAIPTTAVAL